MRRWLALAIAVLIITSIIWLPAITFALTDNYDKFQYYVKALEYGLKGLVEYFKFIIELFKVAISG